MQLRDYQIDLIEKTRALMSQGVKSILLQSPTGSGKTLLTAHMLKTAAAKGFSCWFVCHRRELVKQSVKALTQVGVYHGVIASGFLEDPKPPVQVCSIQTLVHRLDRIPKPKLIVWDESHHVSAGSWDKVFRSNPQAFHVGLTATPQRLDGTGLHKWFQTMLNGPSVSWLIENKFLSPYRLYASHTLNLSGVHSRMGDYIKTDIAALVDKPQIIGDVVSEYKKLCAGKRAVVFCVSIEHSQNVVNAFRRAGISSEHIDGVINNNERDAILERFESGQTLVLTNCDLVGEGFDLPSIEAAILLRPTKSLGLYLQQVGRVLRPSPGKEYAVILDHVSNALTHGLPDDEREWSLHGKTKKEKLPTRTCGQCYAVLKAGSTNCPYCGFIFPVEKRAREIEEVDGTLVEINKELLRRQRFKEQAHSETLADLTELGRRRGYRKPEAWAAHVFRSRQAKKIRGGR